MKSLLLSTAILLSTNSFAESFDCKIYKNNSPAVALVQTTFSHEDPEENTEEYKMTMQGVSAYVIYVPYQDGLFLKLTDVKSGVSARTIFDQESDDYTNLTLNTGTNKYRLTCRKK